MTRIIPVLRTVTNHPYTRFLVWFSGGSSLESDSELGFAHFTEHLFFKLRYQDRGIADFVESLGGYSNAFTGHDAVAIDISLLNEYVPQVIDFLNNILCVSFDSITEKDFVEERSVVMEEIAMYDDEPMERLMQETMRNVWSGHPYGREILGCADTLNSATPDKIDRFARGKLFVRPFVTMSGGFDGECSLRLPAASGELPVFRGKEKASKRIYQRHNQNKDYFISAWKFPETGAKTAAYSKLIHTVTYGMDGSRLYNELVYDNPVFDNISLSFETGVLGATFFHFGAFSPSEEHKKIARWARVWEKMHITRDELNKARETILAERDFSTESPEYLARNMGLSYAMYGDKDRFERDYFYHLFNISLADINRFKQEYLSVDKAVLALAVPQKSRFVSVNFSVTAKKKNTEETRLYRRLPGLKTTLFERPHSRFVSLEMLRRGGAYGDPAGKAGAGSVMINALIASAKGMSHQESENFLDKYGIEFSAVSGNNTIGIKVKARSSVLEETAKIVIDTLTDDIKEDDFQRELEFAIRNYELKMENPSFVFMQAVHKVLFADSPYESTADGTLESLRALTLSDVRTLWKQYDESEKWGVGISGAGAEELYELLKGSLSHPVSPKKHSKIQLHKPINNRITVPIQGKRQVYLAYLFEGPDIYHPDFEHVRFMEHYLMTQNSPLFVMLREKQGLVYSLSAQGMGGMGVGYIMLTAITSPENYSQTEDSLRQVVEHLRTHALEPDVIEQLKRAHMFARAQSLPKNDFHAFNSSLENALNLPKNHYLEFDNVIKQLNENSMRTIAEKWLTDGVWITTVSD